MNAIGGRLRIGAALVLACATTACLSGTAAAGPVAHASDPCGTHPWCDTALSPDQRAALVVAAMTTQEKAGFLSGDDLLNEGGGDTTHTGVQDGVPRLGIPTVNYTDGPQGPRQGPSIGLPAPLALAATFNPLMASQYATVVGDESREKGNEVVFGPTINIMRTPLGGRTYEAFGEDPFLTTSIAVPWIQALQATGEMADVKHFAENNQEGVDPTGKSNQPGTPLGVGVNGTRYAENVIVDDRTLHEIELPAFQAAVQVAHTATVMCAYPMVNGTYACENGTLIQKILRGQWGFDGYVLADYGAAHDTFASLNNGLDFEPWPPAAYQPAEIEAALIAGVPMSTIDYHVKNILATWFRYGIFDRAPYVDDDSSINWTADGARAHGIEEQAVTLLRNQNQLLPLNASRLHRIAVIGKTATTFVTGGGSGNITPHQFTSILAGIKGDVGSGTNVTYDDGSSVSAAVADAKAADVVVVAASDYYTEGADRSCLTLECPDNNGDQDALISAVAAANPRTVVVLESGGPDLTPWRNQVGALVEGWYAGGPGGTAIADVLFGHADPGGRLPVTFPATATQIPLNGNMAEYPGIANEVHYDEGVLVGYRWYDAQHEQPAYPFGYGLSYTTFSLSGLKIAPKGGGGATVSFTVRNTGSRAGYSVPQLYVGLPQPSQSIVEPPAQLAGFDKVELAPGASTRVSLALDSRHLSYWDTASQSWEVAPGCANVMVGTSSRDLPLQGTLADAGATCPTTVPRPRAGCPAPTGRLSGRRLGPIVLGRPRSRVRRGLRRVDDHRARYTDVFCFTPIGIRVGFPPPAAAKRLGARTRRATAGRVVLILTANRHYALRGIRPGVRVAAATRKLRLGRPIRTGPNTWFLTRLKGVTGVLKVRHGRVAEVGIADPRLTRPRRLAVHFLTSF